MQFACVIGRTKFIAFVGNYENSDLKRTSWLAILHETNRLWSNISAQMALTAFSDVQQDYVWF
jgi:hypothetical protein